MPPQDPTGKRDPLNPKPEGNPIDPKSFLLPKKEGPSSDSAQRINAGALLAQEETAAADGLPKPQAPEEAATTPPAPQPAPQPTPQPQLPAAVPAAPVGMGEPAQKKEGSLVKALETYSADISEAVQGGVSMVSIMAAESARRGQAPEEAAEAPIVRRTWMYASAGVILLVAAGLLVALIFWRPSVNVEQTTRPSAFFTVDDVATVSVPPTMQRDALMDALSQARLNVHVSLGLIAQIFVGTPASSSSELQEMPAQQFLSRLAPNIPGDLLRTIEPQYLLGVHSFDENAAFLVLRVDSFEQAYSGMLAWEYTMRQELLPLFSRALTPAAAPSASSTATSTATSTAATSTPSTSPFIRTVFVDQVVANHDARVMLSPQGEIMLLWAFLDHNTLVITTNESTLRAIIERTAAAIVPQP